MMKMENKEKIKELGCVFLTAQLLNFDPLLPNSPKMALPRERAVCFLLARSYKTAGQNEA